MDFGSGRILLKIDLYSFDELFRMNNPSRCAWSEMKCDKPAKKGIYCLKHHDRGVLLEEAKKKGVRICDDGKRACRNETFNSKQKCEECLKKTRELEIAQYNERKAKGDCTMCGKVLENLTKGIKEDLLQKCEACYSTMRKVEDNRVRDRNYAFEKRINPIKHYREYADSAARRNIEFNISIEEFTEVVTKPCYYCKKYDDTEVIGIDRIDSFKGYIKGNILPACDICNTMKKQLTLKEFANHISILYKNFVVEFQDIGESEETLPSHRLRPAKIVEHYYKKTLDIYIELCKADNRSAAYIQKLIDATAYTMTNNQFRNYLENASRVEIRSQQLTLTNERKRVPRNEIFALLKLNKSLEVVKLYESVFGKTKGIKEDMVELGKSWNSLTGIEQKNRFDKYIIKYNNLRSYTKRIGEESEVSSNKNSENSLQTKDDNLQVPIPPTVERTSEFIQPPKQWKVTNIWSAFQDNTESSYKKYLESLEDIKSLHDWEQRWQAFVRSLEGVDKNKAQEIIKAFIINLRTIRHNVLSYKKNNSLLEKNDREVWRTDTILRAFKLNKLEQFKEFTETGTGDNAADPNWIKRWDKFVSDVYEETDDTKKKNIISKFLTAQRTKKYRKSKCATPPTES